VRCPPPAPGAPKVNWTGRGRSSLLALLVGAPQFFLESGVGGAGVDKGQARVNRFVVIVPCPHRHPQPDAVLLESHRGFVAENSPRLGPGFSRTQRPFGSRWSGGKHWHPGREAFCPGFYFNFYVGYTVGCPVQIGTDLG
jgi:hypothetical protein